MKYFIILIAFTTVVFSQPKLEFIEGNYQDWGNVTPDESPLINNVVIKNTGDEVLEILSIKSSCNCLVTEMPSYKVLPNESMTFTISFDVSGANGVINDYINIRTNISDRPYVLYYVNAKVIRDLTFLDNNHLNYKNISSGKSYKRIVRIVNNTNDVVTVSKIEGKPDYIKMNLDEGTKLQPGSIYSVELILTKDDPGGFNFNILIYTKKVQTYNLVISGWGAVMSCNR